MKRRLMGIETEFGLTSTNETYENGEAISGALCNFVHENPLSFEDLEPLFIRRCKNAGQFRKDKINTFLYNGRLYFSNGDVMYSDCGHLEFASRECDNLLELVAADQAIVRLADAVIKKFSKANPEYGKLDLYKNNNGEISDQNNPDSKELTTWASHEDYQIERTSWERRHILKPFLATRHVLFGPGNLRRKPLNEYYKKFDGFWELSGRAHFIESEESDLTTTGRGIINLRDEPWMDKKYMRLHLLVGESNMFSYTTALKFGITSIVLRLMEEQETFNPLQIKNPVPLRDETKKIIRETGAMSQISMHPNSSIEMADGKRMNALDVFEIYLSESEKLFSGEDDETNWVLKHCRFLHDTLRQDLDGLGRVDRALNGFLDWTTMYDTLKILEETFIVNENGQDSTFDISKEEHRNILMRYKNDFSNTDMQRSLAFKYPLHNIFFPISPESVLQKVFDPCFGSRSALRAFALNFYPEHIKEMGWMHVNIDGRKLDLENILFTDYKRCVSLYNKPPAIEDFLEQARVGAFSQEE